MTEAVPTVKGNRPLIDGVDDYVAARNDLEKYSGSEELALSS